MNPAIPIKHTQTFRCSPRSNPDHVTGRLCPSGPGYKLIIEGSGPICAPHVRFHTPAWGRHAEKIHTLEIGEGISEIESSCFSGLKNLSRVRLPETLKAIYSEAFSYCLSLQEITLPSALEYIGPRAFFHCTQLHRVTFGARLSAIESEAFANCTSLIRADLPPDLRKLGDHAFTRCSSLQEVILPDNIKHIAPGTFQNCSRLRAMTIPPSVRSIGDQAFARCTGLHTLDLSRASRLTTLCNSAFHGSKALKQVYILDQQRTFCLYHFHTPDLLLLSQPSLCPTQA